MLETNIATLGDTNICAEEICCSVASTSFQEVGGKLGTVACKYSLQPELSWGQPGDSAHNDRRRSLMDQLTYRSGKWDIINVTLNNNILIYCAAPTAHRA